MKKSEMKRQIYFTKKLGYMSYRSLATNGWRHEPIASMSLEKGVKVSSITALLLTAVSKNASLTSNDTVDIITITYDEGRGRIRLYSTSPDFEEALTVVDSDFAALREEAEKPAAKKPAGKKPSKAKKPAPVQEDNADELDAINPAAIRADLAAHGIVNGEVVNPAALENAPIVKQVTADAEQIAAEEAASETVKPALEVIAHGDGWQIVADAALLKVRVIIDKAAANAAKLEALTADAHFYYSTQTRSYHKNLTNKARRAAADLAAQLNAA